jgi:hypothetical protein
MMTDCGDDEANPMAVAPFAVMMEQAFESEMLAREGKGKRSVWQGLLLLGTRPKEEN